MRKVWKFFCSVKLTVVLFVLILIPSVIGTLIQQPGGERPADFVPNPVFKFLGFYDIYHDPRFIILLVLLGLNTFACTVNRFRPKWNLVGMLMTHVGLLLILLGAVTGAALGVKGFMAIREGETLDKISVMRADERTFEPLPFKVHLVDFIMDMHAEPARTLLVLNVKSGEQHTRPLEKGTLVALSEPRWAGLMSLVGVRPAAGPTVVARRFFKSAVLSNSLSEGPAQTGMRAVEVRLSGGGGEFRGFAVSGARAPYIPRGTHTGISYRALASADEIEAAVREAVASTREQSRIEAVVRGAPLTSTHSARVGSRFEVEGYTVEVLRYVPDFVIAQGKVTSRSELPHNPAIQVRITAPDGATVEQWLFARFPSMHATEETRPFELTYTRSGAESEVVDHVFIIRAGDGGAVVAHARDGELIARAGIAPGAPFTIEGTGLELAIVAFYENANINRKLTEVEGGRGRPAVEVAVGPAGKQTDQVLWLERPVDIPGYRLMYIQEERVKDFYSVLQILDGGKVAAEKKIEVNDPLRYKGYTLYQSSYDMENQSWSGLQVRKDPGVPLVYAGFSVQILGMIVIFYINPLIRKAKKARVADAGATA